MSTHPHVPTRSFALLLMAAGLLASGSAQALSCMVVGEKSARVKSDEGEASPVFMSNSCESLKLISGKAMVSWISRDGKPHFSPITAEGVSALPGAGGEERSARVVWSELSSKREATRPAFMRALDEQHPARLFIPAQGLAFPAKAGAQLSLYSRDESGQEQLQLQLQQQGETPLRLTREQLKAGTLYSVRLTGASQEQWLLKPVSESESAQIQAQLDEIAAAELENDQRRVLRAMLFEQLKLPVNMQLSLATGD